MFTIVRKILPLFLFIMIIFCLSVVSASSGEAAQDGYTEVLIQVVDKDKKPLYKIVEYGIIDYAKIKDTGTVASWQVSQRIKTDNNGRASVLLKNGSYRFGVFWPWMPVVEKEIGKVQLVGGQRKIDFRVYNALDFDIKTGEKIIRQRKYRVREGDTLWKISEKIYGIGFRWKDVLSYNSIQYLSNGNPRIIPNAILTIPFKDSEEEDKIVERIDRKSLAKLTLKSREKLDAIWENLSVYYNEKDFKFYITKQDDEIENVGIMVNL